jgi:hypothetical protein
MPWFVSYEVRPMGAIGVFDVRGLSSAAATESEAIKEVREALHKSGFETRFPVRVYQYQENDE